MGREGMLAVTLDISRHATVVEAVAKGLSAFGRIDCLINIPEIDEDLLERGDFTRGIQAVFQTGIASGSTPPWRWYRCSVIRGLALWFR
ncbi:hypothetical protein [Verrucomicrobium spinosum]|uniref:hypothetical protein n=1 Tax=Verrucomicrobium spinosum TaxID=2736 RepID=UPI000946363C|nr:hypothetical protein [Verrucomicrobium spinosum]